MRTSHLFFLTVAALTAATTTLAAVQQEPPAPAAVADKPAVAVSPAPAPAAPADASKLADKPAAPELAVKTPEDAAKNAVAKGAKDATGHETLSVDFPDEDIRNILRNVADLFELNIIMPETLQGKTTIKLRDVTWRQIFQNVLDPVGYTYVEDGNIIKIVTKESLNDEATTTEVFLINYAQASAILPTISSLVDPAKGKIVVDARSNSLVITERPTRMSRIRPIIEQLDRATDQVMIESKFVEVTNSDVKNIGVNWSSLQNYSLSAGSLAGSITRNRGQTASDGVNGSNGSNQSTTNGTNGSTTNNNNATQTNGANTSSSVTSTNGTPTTTSTTGTNGTQTSTTTNGVVTGTTSNSTTALTNTLNLINSVTNTGDTARAVSAVFSATDFKLVLSALQTLNDVKIVSNPTIVTLNNTEATINIGSEFPVPSYSYNEQRGSFEVSNFTYKAIGVNLKVTPQVNGRGFIKLSLEPEVSQQNGSTTFGGAGGASIPIIASRKAKTTVSLKDGFTMGIGGLLTVQTTKGGTKVPLLGSIPGLGRLFRSDNVDKQQTNLIIFITAKTLSAEGGSVEQIFDSERVRELQLHREDLPGHRDGSDPFLPSTASTSTSSEKTPEKKPFFRLTTGGDRK